MGTYQGPRDEARQFNQSVPPAAKSADAVILSHGHLDHCGKLPVAVRGGFSGPVFCTPATAEIARIVLNDAAKIQAEDLEYLNRHTRGPGQAELEPLYRPADIPAVLRFFRKAPYNQTTELGREVRFTFFDAGHILGSAFVLLEWEEGGKTRNLLFTGDVGRYDAPILRDPAAPPQAVQQLITESTYGNASHGPIADVGPQLLEAVKYVIARRSRAIFPSFAIGRTQTILWYLQKFVHDGLMPPVPTFVDSPMAVESTKVYEEFRDEYDQETKQLIGQKDLFGLARVTLASSVQESKRINRQPGPCVIVASSPTCEFGRVLHHLERSVENSDDLIVFCGYVPPSTLGRRIQEGEKRVRIYDRWYDLKCQVRTIHGLSAHADADELMRFLKPALSAETEAYVVHGEVAQAEAFARRLLAAGVSRATIPAIETSVDAFSAATPLASSQPGRIDQE